MKPILLAMGIFLTLGLSANAVIHFNINSFHQAIQAPQNTGTIINKNGEPFVGVTVTFKGTHKTMVSLANGTYSIDVPAYAKILTVSCVAMEQQEEDFVKNDYIMPSFGPDLLGVTDPYSKMITPTIYSKTGRICVGGSAL